MTSLQHIPNWAWPQCPKEVDSAAIRLGRVLHWTLAGIAALCLLGSVYVTGLSGLNNMQQGAASRAWDKAHTFCVVAKDDKPLPGGPRCSVWPRDDPNDARPFVGPTEFGWLIAGSVVAIGLLMAGRAVRYVASGE